jgi:elongation factor Ts
MLNICVTNAPPVPQAIKEVSAAVGEKISVRRFIKYQLGEGIEKKESNLAAEVAAISGGSS